MDLTAITLEAAKFYRGAAQGSAPRHRVSEGARIDGRNRRQVRHRLRARTRGSRSPPCSPHYDDPALETAGLVIAGDAGKRYDRFRDRIMFPIHDSRGQVIGFGGRVLGEGEPKYLNSPETPLFSKGRELYGLFLARHAIREAGAVVVVEGYMDVVALAQHGIDYAVATLGTSTTPAHVQKLFRQSDRVIFCFDGDAAGRKAAWRALENALPVLADGKNAAFMFLPDGEDPGRFRAPARQSRVRGARREAIPGVRVPADRALRPASSDVGGGRGGPRDRCAPPYRRPDGAGADRTDAPASCRSDRPAGDRVAEPARASSRSSDAQLRAEGDSRRSAVRRNSPATAAGPRLRPPQFGQRRAPSLVRELIQALLLQPELARSGTLPRPRGAHRTRPRCPRWSPIAPKASTR